MRLRFVFGVEVDCQLRKTGSAPRADKQETLIRGETNSIHRGVMLPNLAGRELTALTSMALESAPSAALICAGTLMSGLLLMTPAITLCVVDPSKKVARFIA